MKKLIFLTLAIVSFTLSHGQYREAGLLASAREAHTSATIIGIDQANLVTGSITPSEGSGAILMPFYVTRVLTEEERDSLVYDADFRKKCEWAISDYSSYWVSHDGAGLDDAARAKWRREYQLVKSVWRSDYNDPALAKRFVTLAKGMQFNLDNTPTVKEIIAQFVANSKFDELASSYFDMLAQ